MCFAGLLIKDICVPVYGNRSSAEYSPQSSLTPPNGIKPSKEQYERIAKYTQVSLPNR